MTMPEKKHKFVSRACHGVAPRALALLILFIAPNVAAGPLELHAGLEHRQRGELLIEDYRPGGAPLAAGWFLRTLAFFAVDGPAVQVLVEGIDSRALLFEAPPSNSHIDPVDLLQARTRLHLRGVLVADDDLRVDLGRMTLDVGSRRFIARNDFRNTVSSFTGVDAAWARGAFEVRAFAVTPVRRLPEDPGALASHVMALDRESGALLSGAQLTITQVPHRIALELGAIALHEDIIPNGTAVAGGPVRRLVMPVARLLRRPAAGEIDGQLELAAQWGFVRPVDGSEIERRALSLHASLGYRAALPLSPRVVIAWDRASGDSDANDAIDGRFDPLFGARRFEFGPTGLMGPLARSNLDSTAVRLESSPNPGIDVLLGVRRAALASPQDVWTTTAVRDKSGTSGSAIGDLVESRVRLAILDEVVGLDVGGALFLPGAFARAAAGSAAETWFAYAAVTAQLGRR